MSKRDILLEIGTEEIPARFLPAELKDIKTIVSGLLSDARIAHGEAVSYATPRRLAVIVRHVDEMQRDETREVFGPPKKAAYDKEGKLTKAALGFAKSQGVSPDAITIKDKEGKGEYVCVTVEDKGRPTADVLPVLLRDCVLRLNFPKSMRWGDGTIRYARPIHWIVALYGSEVMEFDLEGIKSGKKSRGHRFLAPADIEISGSDDYLVALEGASVVADQARRMTMIAEQAKALAAEVSGSPEYDDEFLSIVACILEFPHAARCGFDALYLKLPDELLTAVMKGHQKYFPVSGADGKLINSFIIVSNTRADNADTVRVGAERVCRARFEDARFYFTEDTQKPLEDRLPDLKAVTFQEKLGSVYDKTLRVKAVAGALAERICPDQKANAVRAAELSKTDLVTGVVFEFPELQGIMGMYYALGDGEDAAVAEAIREQYLPGFSGDSVPASDPGAVLSLADRADTIASFFSIGLKPTGSEDPFALRRQALGIVAILGERGYDLSVADVMAPALAGMEAAQADVMEFFAQRLENLFLGRGYAHDLVQAVLRIATKAPLKEVYARLDALGEFKAHAKYNEFLLGIKRVSNIIPVGMARVSVDAALFRENEGKALYSAYESARGKVEQRIAGSDYPGALEEMTALTGAINDFFDKVLVMDEDEAVKNNRLGLLSRISGTASAVADFSKLLELEG